MRVRARLHERLWRAGIRHSHILILRCPLGEPPTAPTGLRFEELGPTDGRVRSVNDALDRGLSDGAIAGRFAHGLRFFVLRGEGDRVVATTWVISRGERFLEELGLGLAVEPNGLWLRDVFIAAAERGRGRFAALLDAVRSRWPDRSALWSDVRCGNRGSLHAHLRYGFEPRARYEVVHVASRVLVRLRWPRGLPTVSRFGNSRIVLSGERYRRFAADRRA